MNCRFKVKKYLKGGKLKYNAINKGLLPVFDLQKNAYRMVNFNTVIKIRANKNTYLFV